MIAMATSEWHEANSRYLTARLNLVREFLAQSASREERSQAHFDRVKNIEQEIIESSLGLKAEPALDQLCSAFGLSSFERGVLLLCVGAELDPDFARLCAAAQNNSQVSYPTFGLALATLPEPHWTALVPAAPLRHWRMIELGAADTLTGAQLRIDERVLHYLVGTTYLDERLQTYFEPVAPPASLPASYRAHAEQIVRMWSQEEIGRPVIHLCGDAGPGKRTLAATASGALGLRLHSIRASNIPATPSEREPLIRLWRREAILSRSALLIESDEGDDPACVRSAQQFAERIEGPLFVTRSAIIGQREQSIARVEINLPAAEEQRALWDFALGPIAENLNGQLDRIVAQFRLDAEAIRLAGRAIRESAPVAEPEVLAKLLWKTCLEQSRPQLDSLAERIETRARWENLILSDEQLGTLREIVSHVRQRMRVYETWGFAERNARGLGISALFAGASGTGKTLAAEVIANELGLDLYRIDLSQVVSKYIGETEKNLRSIFDAAENSGTVLLFDEADALFGKRSEVKDSHDRYANIEVSYLLQRMEAYRGLAILTTNRRSAVDAAFLRRLRFVVAFPFPDASHRARIWARIFPPATPTEGLDISKLARLNVTGGSIYNIALNAAFLAADLGEPVRMIHLLHTARSECAKLERPVAAAEIGGWV